MISQFCESGQRKWDHSLADLVFAINTSRQESTGFSPAFLNFGRELEVPKAIYRNSVSDDPEPGPAGTRSDAKLHTDRLLRMQEIFELVRVNLARAFTTQSHHYNLRRREWRCHIGDQVMKREVHLSSAEKGFAAKLAPKYSGPYTVTKVISPVVYELKGGAGRKLKRVHIKDLKPVPRN